MESISKVMQDNFKLYEQFAETMGGFVPMGTEKTNTNNYFKFMETGISEYRTFISNCCGMMGMVLKEDLLELQEEYNALKKQNLEQEELILKLKQNKEDSSPATPDIMNGIQELLSNQSEQFQDMIKATENMFLTSIANQEKSNVREKKNVKKAKPTAVKKS